MKNNSLYSTQIQSKQFCYKHKKKFLKPELMNSVVKWHKRPMPKYKYQKYTNKAYKQ